MHYLFPFLFLLFACFGGKKPVSKHSIRYLALGDSYTIGESVGRDENFPSQLAHKLEEQLKKDVDVQIIARTGWTTDELQAAIDKEKPAGKYDVITLLIGVNNQYRGRDTTNYRPEFTALLEQAIHFAGNEKSRVIVVSIPNYGYTPFGKNKQASITQGVDAYNSVAQQVAESEGIQFVDITEISEKGLEQPALVASDGLHPSVGQYGLWVEKILSEHQF